LESTRLDGKGFRITYPTKKVGDINVAIFHPLEKELSKEIEQAIFEKAAQIFI
jgi:stage V sporulation protein G